MQTYPDHVVRKVDTARRWCAFKVDLSGLLPAERLAHENMTLAKGVRKSTCARPAEFELDGRDYCRRHAGEVLLREALKT